MVALTSAEFVGAQDLIKDTRNGVQSISHKKDVEPNNIAKKVQETLRHTEFMNASAFNLSEGQQNLVAKNKSHVEDAVYLTYNKSEVAKIVNSSPAALNLQIPITENKNIQLELIQNDFRANGFKITTSDGDEFDISDRALFYKGIVKGNPKSIVGISIFDGRISGVISDKDGNYNLGTFENKEDQLVLYNSNLLEDKSEKNCGVDDLKHRIEQERNQANTEESYLKNTDSNTCDSDDCVGIYYEVASSFYNERGSKAAVIEYLTNIFNNAAIVFDNEDIKICISHIFIWTSNDNYVDWDEVDNSRAVQLEQKFAPNLMDYDFPGNIAFLIYHHPSGDGLAWWDGDPLICRDHTITGYGALGVIGLKGDAQDFPNPSRDVQTFVHEKGHTFGSPHTHACEWTVNGVPFQAIDGCADTEPHPVYNETIGEWEYFGCSAASVPISEASLMSYCSGQDIPLSNGFGPLPGQLMRDNYNHAVANGCLEVENNDVFSQYPFISMYVNENNCTSEQITVYNKWNIDFVFIETPNWSRLYRGDTGQLWCTSSTNYDCVAMYGLSNPIAEWECCASQLREEETLTQEDFLIFPNPNNGVFNLMIPGSLQEDFRAEVYSIDGKQLKQIELNGNLQQRIDLAELSSGLYLIRVISDSYNATQKFTIR